MDVYSVEIIDDSFVIAEESGEIVVTSDTDQSSLVIEDSFIDIGGPSSVLQIEKIADIDVIESCEQGPPGPKGDPGEPGAGLDQAIVGPISASQLILVDSADATEVRAAKWIVSVSDETNQLFRSMEILAQHNNVIALYSIYGIIGDSLSYNIDVELVGGTLELKFTNTGSNDLHVSAVRVWTKVI